MDPWYCMVGVQAGLAQRDIAIFIQRLELDGHGNGYLYFGRVPDVDFCLRYIKTYNSRFIHSWDYLELR